MDQAQCEKVVDEHTVDVPVTEHPGAALGYHSHPWKCCGEWDGVGWASCCLAYWCPCVAFGMNAAHSSGRISRGVAFGLMFLLAMVALRMACISLSLALEAYLPCLAMDQLDAFLFTKWGRAIINGRTYGMTLCDAAEKRDLVKSLILHSFAFLAASIGLVTLGVVNRRAMRRQLSLKYGLTPGGSCAEWSGDVCAWCCGPTCYWHPLGFSMCCAPSMALCQETRTVFYDRMRTASHSQKRV